MFARTWQIVVKEIIQYRRDVVLTVFVFSFPVMQLILVANATGSDVVNLPIAIFDNDHSAISHGIIQTLENLSTVIPTVYTGDTAQASDLLQRGDIWAVVVIPQNFATDFYAADRTAQIQVIADGTSVYGGGTALNAIDGALNSYLSRRWREHSAGGVQPYPIVDIESRMRFNVALNKRYNSVPAQF